MAKSKAYDEKYLWPVFSKYIRLRDAEPFTGICRCITCQVPKHWSEGDCGHGIGRQAKSTKYNEKNNHFQCKPCNGFHGGMREAYKEAVNKLYGPDTWDLLLYASKQLSKIGKFEWDIMIQHFNKEIVRLKKEKHL